MSARHRLSDAANSRSSTKRRSNADSRTTVVDDHFAVTVGGVVLVNAMYFDRVRSTDDAVKRALSQGSPLFIGVALDVYEVRKILSRLRDVTSEVGAAVLGDRQRRPSPR